MNPDLRINSLSGWRLGLTLIEVVAGLALAGTLLVSVVLAATSHRSQLRRAELKHDALEATNRFLTCWAADNFSDSASMRAAQDSKVQLWIDETSRSTLQQGQVLMRIGMNNQALPQNVHVIRVEAFVRDLEAPVCWIEIARHTETSGRR
jgi:hypothetical protein